MTQSPYEVRFRSRSRFDVSRETSNANVSRETSTAVGSDSTLTHLTRLNSPGSNPIRSEAARAVNVMNLRDEVWARPERTRVIAVANQKGGVGKTTSTVNLAAALAMHGQRVVVLDLDPQGNASTALGIAHPVGTPSTYDVLLDGAALDTILIKVDVAETLYCAPATIDLAGSEIELTPQEAREYRLRDALSAFDRPADYVLVDCPPSLGLLTLNALVAAQEVLIPIQCEYYALEGLAQLLATIDLVRTHLNPDLAISTVLLTMYDARTRLADQVADEVRAHFGDVVLESVIPRNIRVSEAPGFGQTVMTYDAGSRGATAYLAAARQLAGGAYVSRAPGTSAGDGTDDEVTGMSDGMSNGMSDTASDTA